MKRRLLPIVLAITLTVLVFVLGLLFATPALAANTTGGPVNDFWAQFKATVDGVKVTTLIILIAANFLTGIAVSIQQKVFNLKAMGNFLVTRVVPYVVGYFGVGIIAVIDSSWNWAVTAVWAIILATLVGAILQNLKELGVPIPPLLAGGQQMKKPQ